ncbi:4'-phosphopantetheinyl transferase superfamily protein [Marinobacter sp. HL-58]|uniref:4'-phosphopantetheinyl transferase family protein n=1 Tax=Marinobacter sp. HL-58 TaxID=1479237 RepID=UPI000AE2BBB1|nr:4'-phosphopantetheinyl transferase superfamily protein [Marinobacter sp. HL-58]
MNDSSPDSAPTIWLCREPVSPCQGTPGWLTAFEKGTVDNFSGLRRSEYLCSRWLIRQALAGTSGTEGAKCRPVDGRPVCSEFPPGWHLSLSHSHGLSACAVSATTGLGLDIEPRSRHPHWQKVVRRWFTPDEQAWLLASDHCEDFLRVWTLKEAWLKATGRGIAGNLQTLEVTPDFRLFGDRPGEDWMATSGQVDDFLVALVYRRSGKLSPSGSLLQPPGDALQMDQPARPVAPVRWLFHTPIMTREQE